MKIKSKKIIKKLTTLCVSITLIGGFFLSSSSAISYSNIEQLKGNNRYATASLIAGKIGSYDSVILVNADNNLADGLSASGLAGVLKAPILLVHRDKIPNETQLRIEIAKRIYIIGSENSISTGIENRLKSKDMGGFDVKRIGGSNRFQTSYNVSKEILKIKGSIGKVFVANGYKGEADAMSISPVAARDGEPILLTNGTRIDDNSLSIIEKTRNVYAIGGRNSISSGLVSYINADRLSGSNRYDTNKAIYNEFYIDKPFKMFLSDGYKLVDALTGGPLAGLNNSPIILVGNNSDKSSLSGAKSLVSLGGINKSILNSCVSAANN